MTVRVNDVDAVAAEWFANSQREIGERHCRLDDAARDEPELAWASILKLITQDMSDEQIAFLAAGPLEVLLSNHGEAFHSARRARGRSKPSL